MKNERIYEAIHYMYPDIQDNQFEIGMNAETGMEIQIVMWSYSETPPTQEELDAVYPLLPPIEPDNVTICTKEMTTEDITLLKGEASKGNVIAQWLVSKMQI